MLRVCALAILFVFGAWGRADADPSQAIAGIVRVYDVFGVSARDLGRAQATATAIFAAAGVEIHWRVCATARQRHATGSDPCAAPLGAVEVSMRLIRSRRDAEETESLGFSLIDTARGAGSLATIFPDRVRAIALRAGVPYSAVLGRALAHEIGHLWLGTTNHSPHGLMRPRWSPTVLRARAAEDWAFSADEVVRIGRSLTRARAAGMPASSLAALLLP